MNDVGAIRAAYLDAGRAAVAILGRREVGDRWDEGSVLPEFSLRGLAGHLGRSVLQVEWYLDMPEPDPPLIDAATYYEQLQGADDPWSELNVGVRARGEETASGGWARLYLDANRALDRLSDRLPDVPTDRRIAALGTALLIDEYLKTRVVELCVHLDDLCLSLALPVPPVAADTTAVAIATLIDVARNRHGDRAILRALARRERDKDNALRVL